MEAYLSDIGCSIDPSGFEETANSLVEASNQTGQAEAENLSVHTETTVQSETGQSKDTEEFTNLEPHETAGTTIKGEMPSITPGTIATAAGEYPSVTFSAHIPGVAYTASPAVTTDTVEKTGYAVDTKAEQGSGSSGVHVKPGSVRKNNSGGTKNSHTGGGGGGGGGGGSCFVAGTKISTYFGFKNIEDIQKNDIVLSYNEKTQQNEYSIVLQTMIHNVVEPIYKRNNLE